MTGAHALKFGFNDTGGRYATYDSPATSACTYRFNTNGVTTPNQITEYATPYSNAENLTANLGRLRAGQVDARSADAERSACASTTSATIFPDSTSGPGRSCRTATSRSRRPTS